MHIRSRSLLLQLAWHSLAMLVLVCLPLLKFETFWWNLWPGALPPLAVLLAAYGASALAVMAFVRTEGWRAAGRALAITTGIFSLFLVSAQLLQFETPRYLLLPVFAAAVVLVPLSVSTQALRRSGIAVLAISLIAVTAWSALAISTSQRVEAKTVESFVTTAFYALRIVSHEGAIPTPATRGGGLDRLGDDVLLGTGDGHLYRVTVGPGDDLKVAELPAGVPLNREGFAAAFGGNSRAPPSHSVRYREIGRPRMQTWRFRVADVIVQERGDAKRIFASHHFLKEQERCLVVRVSQLDLGGDEAHTDLLSATGKDQLFTPVTHAAGKLPPGAGSDSVSLTTAPSASASWQTIYETQPCITMTGPDRKRGKNPFRGEEIGGRMALLDENTLLLTLGDHGFYGLESQQMYSQDPQASYGKTIRIDLNTHDHEIYTSGHRNPQGLYIGQDRRVWLTEHGAQGGDEVNLLAPQANYGWPLVTYGTDYGTFAWQLNLQQGRHAGYTQPIYAWVPSIGVSNLIGIERDRFGIWKGDLIAGSLATRSLYRMVVEGDRIVLDEPIAIGKRVRDLLELDDGRILLWTDEAALIVIEPASQMSGALQYATLCSGCHAVRDGMSHRIGPDLFRILDRDVARARGFDEYSPSLKQLGGEWSRSRLDSFLRDPQSAAPGTTMAFAGIADDKERAALIEYLETLSDQRAVDPLPY